jgi:hypothetical protein
VVALASVFVPVRPEFGNFGRDMKGGLAAGFNATEADVAVAGQRHGRVYGQRFTQEGSGQVKRGTSSFREGLGGIATGMAAVAGIQVFAGFIADARESNRIGRLTENVIRSTGGAAHVTADQVGELATSISNKTGADDEAVQSAANLLLTFTGVRNEVGRGNDVFNQATQLAVDMSAALGTDASGAALQLGKALNDPIKGVTALTRSGVSFTAQQRDQIKAMVAAGNTLGAQRVILAEVGREFGGAAAAASDPLQRLGVIVGNVGEDLGNALLPAIDSFATFMADTGVPIISKFVNGLQAVPAPVYLGVAAVGVLGGGILAVNRAIGVWQDVTKGVNTVLDLLAARATAAAAAEGAQAAGATGSAAATGRMALAAEGAGAAFGGMIAKLSLAGGVAGLALISDQASQWQGRAEAATVDTNKLSTALLQMQRTGQVTGPAVGVLANQLSIFGDDVHSSEDFMSRFAGMAEGAFSMSLTNIIGRAQSGSERMDRFNATAKQMDAALAGMVSSGHASDAQAFMDRFRKATGLTDEEFQHVTNRLPLYTAAVAGVNATGAAGAVHRQSTTLQDLLDKYPKYKDTVLQAAGATSADKAASTQLSSAQVRQVASAVNLKAATDALTDSLDANKNATLQLRGGETAWYAAVAAASKAVKENGRTLDVHSEKGRANRGVLDALASSSLGYLRDIQQNIGVGAQFKRTLDRQWQTLYDAARRFGATRAEARNYANDILKVPRAVATKVTQPGMDAARAKVQGLSRDIRNVNGKKVRLEVTSGGEVIMHVSRYLSARATGGPIPGHSPTPTADNVLVRATAGEHMWSVAEVNAAGGHQAVAGLRKAALSGALRGTAQALAAGGPVNRTIEIQGSTRGFPAAGAIPRFMDAVLRTVARAEGKYQEAQQLAAASGGGANWQQLWAIVHGAFPGARLFSSYRPGARTRSGSVSYHALGKAIDVTPSMNIFNWIASHYPRSAELIFSPAGYRQIHNGARHMYTGGVRADHWNHVHWALGGSGGGGPGGPGGGSGVARWRGVILQALRLLGQSSSWESTVERRMRRESAGNPRVVNKWDSNWRAGTPSVGLMQVIGPTFRANAGRFAHTGPFLYGVSTNPLANTYAGLHYALRRYHSLGALNRAGGYDSGGWLPPGGVGVNGTGRPERVLDPPQSEAFQRWMDRGAPSGDTGVVKLHPATIEQIAAALAMALSRQPVVLDGQTLAGHIDRRLGTSGLSMRG